MRKVSSAGKGTRAASPGRAAGAVPPLRTAKATAARAPRGAAEGLHTPIWFEEGHWWPDEVSLEIPTEEREATDGSSGAAVQRRDVHSAKLRRGVTILIPGLKTVSEANLREHWRSRAARTKAQKDIVTLMLRPTVAGKMLKLAPLVVTMTRMSPGPGLDTDNMVGSQKHVRDAIAKVLGVDDKDPRVEWVVKQKKGPWAVEVHIAGRS